MSDPSLVRFRVAVQGALAHLESRRQEINDLNVFPVADGDTGDNMALTLRAVLTELDRLEAEAGDRTVDEIGRDEIVETVARAALLGARGNSGVILSQLIRGAAEELVSRPGELVDPVLLGAAFANAANRAYASVQAPAEGTMLTVMRDMATSIAHDLAHLPEEARRLSAEADVETQNLLIAAALERAIVAGEASVKRGPELLPALREAGVVDAGGYGVIIIFAGIVAALKGTAPELQHYAPAARVTHPEHASETYRYCTNFAVTGSGLESQRFVPLLEAIGDSILVVGDHATLKVHVHTDHPQQATELFEAAGGEVSRLDVADMRAQVVEREARLGLGSDGNGAGAGGTDSVAIEHCCGALAVARGAGLTALFEGLGATVLDGGPTLNPSTMEILAGIHDVPAEEVVVLPNSSNVFMAAERAAELSDKKVVVVPSRSQQAGLSAAFALNADRSAAENATAMNETLEAVRTGGVAPAARQDPEGRFAIGDAVGYVGERLVAWGEPSKTLQIVLGQLSADAELVTCIEGEGAPLDGDAVAALAPAGVELELEDGGQPSWWWLLAAE
ncbi:MAG TPA: DAK2 domain-containing protein [Baekduia sp.]|uniref:DAK2 domain-containing protein n=1 Tax=Baekduia sp. TaxID=2600305 RepID=UPI002D76C035|nr:DAK2 domain-containing protein [Baekduia sp.]HET6508561.1 DAK2 domain-containing protein [Baekduia sp.]